MLKVQEIRELIKLIDQSSIDEFTYETNDTTVSMKKSGENNGMKKTENNVPHTSGTAVEIEKTEVKTETVEPIAAIAAEPETSVEQDTEDYGYEIVSPMVGTFYRSSSPESGPYVENGSMVHNDTVVCIVEAMKLFNEIEAETTGEIVEILAEDGELVEYGQPLFRVKTI